MRSFAIRTAVVCLSLEKHWKIASLFIVVVGPCAFDVGVAVFVAFLAFVIWTHFPVMTQVVAGGANVFSFRFRPLVVFIIERQWFVAKRVAFLLDERNTAADVVALFAAKSTNLSRTVCPDVAHYVACRAKGAGRNPSRFRK